MNTQYYGKLLDDLISTQCSLPWLIILQKNVLSHCIIERALRALCRSTYPTKFGRQNVRYVDPQTRAVKRLFFAVGIQMLFFKGIEYRTPNWFRF